jgi:hypothetical protein
MEVPNLWSRKGNFIMEKSVLKANPKEWIILLKTCLGKKSIESEVL